MRTKRRRSSRSSSSASVKSTTCSRPAGDGERQLVLREEVRHARDVDQRGPLADPRGDALEPCSPPDRPSCRASSRASARTSGAGWPRKPFELVERFLEPLRFDRLQQVVHGVHRERVDRVAVVRGREDDPYVAIRACRADRSRSGPASGCRGRSRPRRGTTQVLQRPPRDRSSTRRSRRAWSLSRSRRQPFDRQRFIVHDVGAQHDR